MRFCLMPVSCTLWDSRYAAAAWCGS
jgi:hypothetical protein